MRESSSSRCVGIWSADRPASENEDAAPADGRDTLPQRSRQAPGTATGRRGGAGAPPVHDPAAGRDRRPERLPRARGLRREAPALHGIVEALTEAGTRGIRLGVTFLDASPLRSAQGRYGAALRPRDLDPAQVSAPLFGDFREPGSVGRGAAEADCVPCGRRPGLERAGPGVHVRRPGVLQSGEQRSQTPPDAPQSLLELLGRARAYGQDRPGRVTPVQGGRRQQLGPGVRARIRCRFQDGPGAVELIGQQVPEAGADLSGAVADGIGGRHRVPRACAVPFRWR
ncbi:hypothetical protein SHIRM173S_09768 [Streptomyces hirsutus]